MSSSPDFFSDGSSLERAMRPTARTWAKHFVYFLLTFFTATLAGTIYPFGQAQHPLYELNNVLDSDWYVLTLPFWFVPWLFLAAAKHLWFVFNDFTLLKQGLSFSIPLLCILTAHEFGHYIACRIYNVDATLPYFIPVPLISPAGTLGAVIKILSPMPSRKAVFDIGVAGPIAGFIALIPVAVIAFLTMEKVNPQEIVGESELYFSDGLLIKLFALIFGYDLNFTIPNGFYFAAWIGLLITAMNLIPSGQLDGGHALYAVFGEKIHHWTGRISFILMALISITGFVVFSSPSGFLFTILLGIMLRFPHPEPLDDSPLDFKRKVIAFLTLVIFILSFVPFPIRSSTPLF